MQEVRQLPHKNRPVTVHMISKTIKLNRDVCHWMLCNTLGKQNECKSRSSHTDKENQMKGTNVTEHLERARSNPTFGLSILAGDKS